MYMHPDIHNISKLLQLQSLEKKIEYEVCIEPRTAEEMWETEYGTNFPGPVWKILALSKKTSTLHYNEIPELFFARHG